MKRNYKFDCKVELPLKVMQIKENRDNIIVTLDFNSARKNLEKLSKSKLIDLTLYSRGWKIINRGETEDE